MDHDLRGLFGILCPTGWMGCRTLVDRLLHLPCQSVIARFDAATSRDLASVQRNLGGSRIRALVSPMAESLLALSMESHERARISAMVYVALILLISPFGWIAGQLSALDRSLPFALNMGLFAVGLLLVWLIGKPGFVTLSPGTLDEGRTDLADVHMGT
jgi:hypothetical protein